MIECIKGYLFLIKQYRKQKKLASYLHKVKKHALLTRAYYEAFLEECGLDFQIEDTNIKE